jgi:8-oxo-dGTP pyrophosphatase MutT (NUDIX family)
MDDVEFPKAFSSYGKKYRKLKHLKQQRSEIYGAILYSKRTGRYLLVKGRETGKYSFPKGHIEPRERPIECIVRELYEETGIELMHHMGGIQMKELVKSKIGTYLYCETNDELTTHINDNNEIEEARWFSIADIRKLLLNADAGYYLKATGEL